ncbi:hypothetical protein [Natronospora cellulosivora (SeqCode)]
MRNFKYLKLIDKCKNTLIFRGIDYQQFRLLLTLKLTNLSGGSEVENLYWRLLGLVPGLLISLIFFLSTDILTRMTIIWAIIIYSIFMNIISHYSSLLLDGDEREYILSRPVSNKEYSLVRVFLLIYYISMNAAGLSLFVFMFGFYTYGFLFPIIFFLELLLILPLIVVLVVMTYTFFLKYFNVDKLYDIINGLSTILGFFFPLLFMLIVYNVIDLGEELLRRYFLIYIFPPSWFAAPFEIFLYNKYIEQYFLLSLMAFIIPVLIIMMYYKYFAQSFDKNIFFAVKKESRDNIFVGIWKSIKTKINLLVLRFMNFNKKEKTLFQFSLSMFSSDDLLKIQLSSISSVVVFSLIPVFGSADFSSLAAFFDNIEVYHMYIGVYLGVFAFMLPDCFKVCTATHFDAAWIIKTLPLKNKDLYYKATLKAVFWRFYTVNFLVISLVWLILLQEIIIVDLLIIFFHIILSFSVFVRIFHPGLPFSRELDAGEVVNLRHSFLMFVVGVILGAIHLGLYRYIHFSFHLIYILLLYFLIKLIWKQDFGTNNLDLK